jgi:hypothetical protein
MIIIRGGLISRNGKRNKEKSRKKEKEITYN